MIKKRVGHEARAFLRPIIYCCKKKEMCHSIETGALGNSCPREIVPNEQEVDTCSSPVG